MTLPASGNPISFSQVDVELGYSATAQISMNDSAVRTLFGVASGAIGMSSGLGKSNTSVPGAPTGVSASATSCSAISVSFTAPTCTGHLTIDYYQAVCTGSGTHSATGSSPISVTGLSPSTSYTFKVRAHNSVGYGSYSSSTGTATTSVVTGSASFTTPGCYTWYTPSCVTSISGVAIGGAGAGGSCYCSGFNVNAGGGGGLVWHNNFSAFSGYTCTTKHIVSVGPGAVAYAAPYSGGGSYLNCGNKISFVAAGGTLSQGGYGYVQIGGSLCTSCGGYGGRSQSNSYGGPFYGGGGAAGYGGCYCSRSGDLSGAGLYGGGASGGTSSCRGGGGTGIYGQGTSGSLNGGGGSGGSASSGTTGGSYGGGAGTGGHGGGGALRIVWPGNTRTFPSTNVGSP